MEVNGRYYPMWGDFVKKKKKFIGGKLTEYSSYGNPETTIKDITLTANGDDSAWFQVTGEDFRCGFDVQHGCLDPNVDGVGGVGFSGTYGPHFRVQEVTEQ